MYAQDRLQTWLYSLGEGGGRLILRVFIGAVVLAALFTGYAASEFRGLREASAMDLAQVARNLAAGHGYTTRCLRPADLAYLARTGRPGPDPQRGLPDLRHAPLHPAAVAAGLRLLRPRWDATRVPGRLAEPEVRVLLPLGFLWTLLTAGLVYVAGSRWFSPLAGGLGALSCVLSERVLGAVIGGGSIPLEMFLTTAALAAAVGAGRARAAQRSARVWLPLVIASGVSGGLAALTAYPLLIVPVLSAALVAAGFVRWRLPLVALVLVLAFGLLAPWCARNVRLSGQPFGLAVHAALNQTWLFPGADGWDRAQTPPPAAGRVLEAVRAKALRQAAGLYREGVCGLAEGLVMAFFLVALFHRFDEDHAGPLKWALLAGVAGRAAVAACGGGAVETLLPFLPLLALVAAALFVRLLEAQTLLPGGARQVAACAWVAAAALPALLAVAGGEGRRAYPPYAPPVIAYVDGLLPPGEILATDMPWAAAWYGSRVALQLPRTPRELQALHAAGLPVGGVYLTTLTGGRPYVGDLVQGPEADWLPLLNQLVPEDFPWRDGFAIPPGRRDQLFLTTAGRWTAAGAARPR